MVDAVSTNTAQSRVNAGGQMMASNFETFLSLLTAQLRNQDPLSPVDSNQFTAQLTQMAGVEQQLLTNDLLTSLLAAQQVGGLGEAAQYIGKEATAAWSAVKFQDGKASWSYELASDAKDATLQVLNSAGQVVWTGKATELKQGVHDFSWDGKTTGGGQAVEDGVYTLKITAKDAAAKTIESQVLVRGVVSQVEMYDGQPFLTIGHSILPLSSVISLSRAANEQAPANPAPQTPNNPDPQTPPDEESLAA